MKICLPGLISAALCCSPILANASEPTTRNFQPTSFNFSPSALENALNAVDLPQTDPIAVYCQSDISDQGSTYAPAALKKTALPDLKTRSKRPS